MTYNEPTNKKMPIFSQRLAGYLMQHGFVLMNMAPNQKQPDRNVFYFVDSAELEAKIAEYKISCRR